MIVLLILLGLAVLGQVALLLAAVFSDAAPDPFFWTEAFCRPKVLWEWLEILSEVLQG